MSDHESTPRDGEHANYAHDDHHAHGEHDGHGGHGIHLPSPSIWPIVSAFGITMISFGILTGWPYVVFGALVLAISLWKWAGEMRRDAA